MGGLHINTLTRSSCVGRILLAQQTRTMGIFTSRQKSTHADLVKEKIDSNCIMIFSKSTCPFCIMAKQTFDKLGAGYEAIELNCHSNGNEIQAELHKLTGSYTVPQVFVNGKFLGGGTETKKLYESGQLSKLVEECSITAGKQAKL